MTDDGGGGDNDDDNNDNWSTKSYPVNACTRTHGTGSVRRAARLRMLSSLYTNCHYTAL